VEISHVSQGISVCLQQGRMFLESASNAGTEIRPLLLYYGIMAFAKAVTAARGLKSIATLSRSHGLEDTSSDTAPLAELKITIGERGTFQEFNEVTSQLASIAYYENAILQRHPLPTARSAQLQGVELTLKDILARIPRLADLYRLTFREDAKALPFHVRPTGRRVELRIDVDDRFFDRASLVALVARLRQKYPTLQRWRLVVASSAYSRS
jgi:YaaC-like Protein